MVKTPSGTWKAVIRKIGFPTVKTFRLKRDTEDWSGRAEAAMVCGMFLQRGPSERMTFEKAIKRHLAQVTPTKRPFTQVGEKRRAVPLTAFLGKYSLAGITPELVAQYRDKRLAGEDCARDAKPRPRAGNTVRLELALIGHLFTIAIKEWGLGLAFNPVLNIRRPSPGAGRNRRLAEAEERNSWVWSTATQTPRRAGLQAF